MDIFLYYKGIVRFNNLEGFGLVLKCNIKKFNFEKFLYCSIILRFLKKMIDFYEFF